MQTKGKIFIISGPTGAGKTTFSQRLRTLPDIERVVTYTTRSPRDGEKNGIDYNFVSIEDFEIMISQNEMLEYAQVYKNYYGSRKKDVEAILKKGKSVLFAIDVQGAMTLKKLYQDSVLIFLVPPSLSVLKQRLLKRGDDIKITEERLKEYESELSQAGLFNYQVKNDNLESSLALVKSLIEKELFQ